MANAGIGIFGSILEHTDEESAEMMDVNYAGTVWGVRAAVPALIANGGGDIVIIASVAGLRGGPSEAVYAGTKFAQVAIAARQPGPGLIFHSDRGSPVNTPRRISPSC